MIRTKVDIVSGFLGAGKTTFIKKLLAEAISGEKVVLIENEFGEIGIDGGFLKDAGIEIREMSQGCICCSLVGDFAASLKEILTKYRPDRIIIEPSGVGKLSDVMKAVSDVENELEVENNSAIAVVDAKKCRLYHRNFGEFFNNQIQFASTIVLSRTDIAEKEKIDEAVEIIRELNPKATIITTPIDLLSGEKLLEILESPVDLKAQMLHDIEEEECDDPECECHHHHEHEHHHHEHCHHHDHNEEDDKDEHCCHHHHDEDDEDGHCCHHHDHDHEDEEHEHCHHEHEHHHHHHHHADEVFESWGMESAPAISREELENFLNKLSETEEFGKVIRAKGMLESTESSAEWFYFDMVPGQIEIRSGEPDAMGKLCVIGAELNEDALDREFGK